MTKDKKRYGLSKAHTKKKAREFVDQDYIDKLSEEEKDWLDKFNREYYQNSFSKNDEENFHKKGEERRKAYGRENARNRDMWNKFDRSPGDLTANEYQSTQDTSPKSERIKNRIKMGQDK